jgi:hypothetical protein
MATSVKSWEGTSAELLMSEVFGGDKWRFFQASPRFKPCLPKFDRLYVTYPKDDPILEENWPPGLAEYTLDQMCGHVLAMLPERQRGVIYQRFWERMTFRAISQRLGKSRERIRQIQQQGLRRLRHPRRASFLRPYLSEEYPYA